MSQTAIASAIIAEARQRADAETATPTVDHTTDTELLGYLTKVYRELLDLIISQGDAAIALLLTSTTLATPYTLPADFYRLAAVDMLDTQGRWRALKPFQFAQRNDHVDPQWPRYRLVAGALKFAPPTAAPSSLQVWYIPFPASLAATTDTVQSFNGWDNFLVGSLWAAICDKEDRDTSAALRMRGEATARIMDACANLVIAETQTIAETERQLESIYDLI